MRKATTIICLGALSLASSGCALFRSQASLAYAKAVRASRDIPYDGSFEYEAGRAALREGRYGEALQSLRRSELYPKYRALSANGMAIAYAALERDDLALYFFRKAVDAEPNSDRFQANLATLQARMVRAASVDLERQAQVSAPPPVPASGAVRIVTSKDGSFTVVADRAAATNLVRLSDREVRIVDRAAPPVARPASLAWASRNERAAR